MPYCKKNTTRNKHIFRSTHLTVYKRVAATDKRVGIVIWSDCSRQWHTSVDCCRPQQCDK